MGLDTCAFTIEFRTKTSMQDPSSSLLVTLYLGMKK